METITTNQDIWVAVMMAEEHQLSPPSAARLCAPRWWSARLSCGSLIPLLPFFFLPVMPSMVFSVVITAAVLFGCGSL